MKKDYIYNVIKDSNESLTAEEVYDRVSEQINVNLSTVYRTLNNLVDKDELTKVIRQDKIAYYELADNAHKHYIVCDKCNHAFPTNDCNIEKLEKKIKKETGFSITSHTLEFHGICPTCLKG